jgi:general secretion pathway protein N
VRRRPARPPAAAAQAPRAGRWIAAGVCTGALLMLLWAAPARWAAAAVERASGGHLLLADARGTVWQGSAVMVLTGGPGSRDASALPGRLDWRLAPRLRGGPGLALQAEHGCCLTRPLTVLLRPGIGRIAIELPADDGWTGQWPSAWLVGLGTPWNTLQPGGVLRLRSQGLTLESVQGRWRVDGAAELALDQLSSRLSPLPALGSYRLLLNADPASPGSATLTLTTTEGALQLRGDGRWDAGGLRLRGEARAAAPADEAALGNLLNIIGRRQGARSVISIG